MNAQAEVLPTDGLAPSGAVLSLAADRGTAVIVMGACGHSRVREMILGGMAQDILKIMSVPVLMAH